MNNGSKKNAHIDPRVLGLIIGITTIIAPFGRATFGTEENIQPSEDGGVCATWKMQL